MTRLTFLSLARRPRRLIFIVEIIWLSTFQYINSYAKVLVVSFSLCLCVNYVKYKYMFEYIHYFYFKFSKLQKLN